MRRLFLTIAVMLAMPAYANAWYVTSSALRSAGDSTSRVNPVGQTYVPGLSGFKNISAIAGSGFQLNRVILDGVALCPSPTTSVCANSGYYRVDYAAGKIYRSLNAYFGPATISGTSITVISDSHCSYKVISPINGTLTDIIRGDSRTISIIPYTGYAVTGTITAVGCTIADSPANSGAKDVVSSNIQNPITVNVGNSVISQVVTADAGPDRTTNGTGSANTISLGGSSTYIIGPVTYAWSAVGVNAGSAHFGSPAAASTTFFADASGTYTVQLIATAAGPTVPVPATAIITVLNTGAYLESLCTSCHASRNATVVSDYDASRHKTATAQVVACQTCHDPTQTGHYTIASPVDSCRKSHPDSSGNVLGHPLAINGTSCVACHNPHSTVGGIQRARPITTISPAQCTLPPL